jgi:hypothetical protein
MQESNRMEHPSSWEPEVGKIQMERFAEDIQGKPGIWLHLIPQMDFLHMILLQVSLVPKV